MKRVNQNLAIPFFTCMNLLFQTLTSSQNTKDERVASVTPTGRSTGDCNHRFTILTVYCTLLAYRKSKAGFVENLDRNDTRTRVVVVTVRQYEA
ncbi:hypothetical protein HDV62DRAFT_218679 [Trichoderma sp. SZMC 28011]